MQLDASLIASAAAGDATAREMLLRACREPVRAACRRHSRRAREHEHSLDETCQDVFVEFLSALPALRGRDVPTLRRFLDVLALRACADRAQRAKRGAARARGHEAETVDAIDSIAAIQDGPGSAVVKSELQYQALIALSELDDEDRDIVTDSIFRHLAIPEIADARGISPETARGKLGRALGRLRAIIVGKKPR